MKELLDKQIERYRVEVKQLRRRTSSSVSAIVADTLEGVIANLEALVTEIKRTEKAEAKQQRDSDKVSLVDAASRVLRGEESLDEAESEEFEEYEDTGYAVGTTYNSNPRGYRPTVYEDGKMVFSTVFVWKDQDTAIEAAKKIVDKKFFENSKDGVEFGMLRFVLDALKNGELTHNNEKYLKLLMK
jgi:hypothetical protein